MASSKKKPEVSLNLSISSVYDEESQTFNLFNRTRVGVVLFPKKKCTSKHAVMVPSAPRNEKLRWRLRKQLSQKAFLLFLVGKSGSEDVDKMLEEENDKEGDILQADFIDSYRSLPFKIIKGYIWINRCSAKFFNL